MTKTSQIGRGKQTSRITANIGVARAQSFAGMSEGLEVKWSQSFVKNLAERS